MAGVTIEERSVLPQTLHLGPETVAPGDAAIAAARGRETLLSERESGAARSPGPAASATAARVRPLRWPSASPPASSSETSACNHAVPPQGRAASQNSEELRDPAPVCSQTGEGIDPRLRLPLRQRLSYKQARNTAVIALLLGLILTTFQVGLELSQLQRNTDAMVRQLMGTIRHTAAEAAYTFDQALAARVLDGLLHYKIVHSAEIRDDFGNRLAYQEQEEDDGTVAWFAHRILSQELYTIPLVVERHGTRPVGELRIDMDHVVVASDYFRRALATVSIGILWTATLTGVLMVVFYLTITKPILRISRGLAAIDPARPAQSLLTTPTRNKDELALVVRTANNLLRQFAHSLDQRQRAEDQLKEREARLSGIMENIADSIITVDSQYCIESLNRAAERLFACAEKDTIGRPLAEFIAEGEDWRRVMVGLTRCLDRQEENAEDALQELSIRRRDGSEVPVSLGISRMWLDNTVTFICVAQDITERRDYEKQLMYLATRDPLTGLANRTLLQDRLSHALSMAYRKNATVAVLHIDLDRFKLINDTLGHAAGDELLRAVAVTLGGVMRPTDTVGRLSGDEFLVIAEDLTEPQDASRVATAILHALARLYTIEGHALFITPSIGIAVAHGVETDTPTLLRHADTAMHSAKVDGGNTYRYFMPEMNEEVVSRLALEHALREAVEDFSQFQVHYQLKVEIATLTPVGLEALLRWRHPEQGFVSPARFIPLAEEMGLIIAIGQWVTRSALAQIRAWQEREIPPLPIAVNLSVRQLTNGAPVERIQELLDESGVSPDLLELEVTESVMMDDAETIIGILHQLRALGLKIAIDDFGTGYSSLSYLRRLPITALKVDRSFVDGVTTSADDAAIAATIIAMGRQLGLKVVAEGIEAPEQIRFLKEHDCDQMQGFYIARPMPVSDLEARFLHQGVWRLPEPPVL